MAKLNKKIDMYSLIMVFRKIYNEIISLYWKFIQLLLVRSNKLSNLDILFQVA